MPVANALPLQVDGRVTLGFKRILVLISLTEGSRETLTLALNLSKQHGGEVVLLHAIDPNVGEPAEELEISRDHVLGLLRREAESEMNRLIQMANPEVPAKIIVAEGNPLDVVAKTANALAVDLIVTCQHSARRLC